ncbi:MAG: hypothetical protein FWC09_00170 [Lachnospiraceae bacterium]|nr:hypothetical protein [Lachnospiraceae bacterium]
MTNKIMQNNSLYNINNNKILQDKLSTNMSTQKKLTRPSDDPIIAIRALRLRTSVSEITQYHDRNAKDAAAWLNVTEDALSTANEIIGGTNGLIKQMQKAANKDLTPVELNIIMEQIKSLRDEVYATANVDYAGRYIFTGFRTETTLSFTKDVLKQDLTYSITEQLNITKFDQINYTDLKDIANLNKTNYLDFDGMMNPEINEQMVENVDIWRLRLSYDKISDDVGNTVITFVDPSTGTLETIVPAIISINNNPDPFQLVKDGPLGPLANCILIPETGEIVFSDNFYKSQIKDKVDAGTEIRVTYEKSKWLEGDLRPEHYFACVSTENKADGTTKVIPYNTEYLSGEENRQIIEYDVGYNQRIRINTRADEIFQHTMDRNVDDLDLAVRDLMAIQATLDDFRRVFDGITEGSPEYDMVQKQLDALSKAYDYIRQNVHQMFEKSITVMQKALDDLNIAVTDAGTRSARLDLISNRLMSQKTTFEVLKSENEDVDIAEIAIKLNSTELSYNAALMATGKIMQTSLMNYI